MALRDYVCCSKCGVKIFYDGDQSKREVLEDRWGNPKLSSWTVKLLCPDCIEELQAEVAQLRRMAPSGTEEQEK